MIEGITQRYLETKTSHIQIGLPFSMNDEIRLQMIEEIRSNSDVVAATFEIDGIGLAASGKGSTSAQIRGIEQSIMNDSGFLYYMHIDEGALFPKNAARGSDWPISCKISRPSCRR